MKTQILLVFLLIGLNAQAQTYYWVGGSGNWSDAAHWATTSGGSTMYPTPPGINNDVRFDQNSFTQAGQVVTLDQSYQACRNLDATGVLFNPMLNGLVYTDVLEISGNLTLPAAMNRDLKSVEFSGSGSVLIDLDGTYCGSLSFIRLTGSGNYHLAGDFSAANLYMYGSGMSFNSEGYEVNAALRIVAFSGASGNFNFTGSTIFTNEWSMASNSTYTMTGTELHLGGVGYLEVAAPSIDHPTVIVDGPITFADDFTCGSFTVMPGSAIEMTAGKTITADSFSLNGDATGSIEVFSGTPGEAAFFSQATGDVNGYTMVLTDIHAVGGATFYAHESVDNGNNNGWIFLVNTADTYFWVGGSGDFTDLSHWATTSGGNVFHTDFPDLNDPVVFDANSFSSSENVVTLSGDITLVSVDATGALQGATIETAQGLGNSLTILSAFNAGNLNWHLATLNFTNADDLNFITGAGSMSETAIRVNGGGAVQMIGDLTANGLQVTFGDFFATGSTIVFENDLRMQGIEVDVAFIDCDITTPVIDVQSDVAELDLSSSTISCSALFSIAGWICPTLILSEECDISGPSSVVDLIINPGAQVHFYGGTQMNIVNSISAVGTLTEMITIDCLDTESQGGFYKESGLVEVVNCNITNNHATGGATFNAINSNDGGNTDGWNFITSVPELETTELLVWPNPADGDVWVNTEAHLGEQLILFDSVGRKVIETRITTTSSHLNVAALPAGMYVLTTHAGELTSRSVISIQ